VLHFSYIKKQTTTAIPSMIFIRNHFIKKRYIQKRIPIGEQSGIQKDFLMYRMKQAEQKIIINSLWS